jgi:hypothetical protein
MRIHRPNGLPGAPAGQEDHTTAIPAQRHSWRPRRRRDREPAPRADHGGSDVQTMAGAVQLAIGLLTASLDSPELEAWAVLAMVPEDPAALGEFIAGLHVVARLLLDELEDATGHPPAATLQNLAMVESARNLRDW